MPAPISIHRAIRAYRTTAVSEHHRYRSWEHCYRYFRRHGHRGIRRHRDDAALHLGFYLASWGMYRGSSFILQHAYTIHRPVIDVITRPQFGPLWRVDFGKEPDHEHLGDVVLALAKGIYDAYVPFAKDRGAEGPTDTLVTKVILGTVGCLPACDRFFISGFKACGNQYSYLNERFVERLLAFCQQHRRALLREQAGITGCHYPLMKLVDTYFWQIGYEKTPGLDGDGPSPRP